VEAGLTWTIGKRRREACDFLGGDVIKKQLADGVSVRRVGLVSGGAPARAHSEITTPEGEKARPRGPGQLPIFFGKVLGGAGVRHAQEGVDRPAASFCGRLVCMHGPVMESA